MCRVYYYLFDSDYLYDSYNSGFAFLSITDGYALRLYLAPQHFHLGPYYAISILLGATLAKLLLELIGAPLFKTGAAPQKNFGFMQFQKVLFDPQIIASAEFPAGIKHLRNI